VEAAGGDAQNSMDEHATLAIAASLADDDGRQ
jgi:hypothetical protein